jgi:hypothetical protein
MASRRPKRPRYPNQFGKLIMELSIGEAIEPTPAEDSSASEFARPGGLKGGRARAAALTPKQRRAKLPLEKRAQILHLLLEGNSLRATARLADVSFNTTAKLFIDAARACAN